MRPCVASFWAHRAAPVPHAARPGGARTVPTATTDSHPSPLALPDVAQTAPRAARPARATRSHGTPRTDLLGWVGVLFPLACSIAANFAWAARDGDLVAIIAGCATPLLLVNAAERWRATAGLEGWRAWARFVAIVLVTAVPAAVSWVHTTRLLLAHGWEWPLAVAWPLGVDGLAVLGTLALWSNASAIVEMATEDTTPKPVRKPAPPLHAVPDPIAPCDDPDGAPPHTLVTVDKLDDLSRDELRAVAREHDETVRGSAEQLRERLAPVLAACPHPAHAAAQAAPEVTA